MARIEELRLIATVARLYYLDDMKQVEIAERLSISQAMVSRLLRRARQEKLVKITVAVPGGTFPALEDGIRRRFGLRDVVVADCGEDREEQCLARIGEAAAHYLETTLRPGEVIGISSWSATLVRMVDNLHPGRCAAAARVVQILGGIGNPAVQGHATQLTARLARLTGATAVPLATQGIAATPALRRALIADPYVAAAMASFGSLTTALVGVGTVEPSKLLSDSGNVFTADELAELTRLGGVGDICLHFVDRDGRPIRSALDERVIGITMDELSRAGRVVAVAGGARKVEALQGVLRSGLVTVLITDRFTAAALADAEVRPVAG
jgi:DNA-binding transcriptional regulator LsrR (DeoR family)